VDIWIDIDSGTYGSASSVRVVSLTPEEVDELAYMSDDERSEIGENRGQSATQYGMPWNETVKQVMDQKFHEARVRVAEEEPPNETQVIMTEGVLIGLDIGQSLVREVLDGE
jgi:hypothetical protein